MANVLLPLHQSINNLPNYFPNISGYIPLQQAWAYQHHNFGKSFTSLEGIWDTESSQHCH